MSEGLRDSVVDHLNEALKLMQKGKYKEALEKLEKAGEAVKFLLKNPENEFFQSELYTKYYNIFTLGYRLHNMGRFSQAQNFYELSLLISQKLLKNDPDNIGYQSDVAMTLNNLGILLSDMGRIEDAKDRYEKALGMRQKLLKNDPDNVVYQSDVGTTLNNLGNLLSDMGCIEEAKQRYEKALEIYEKLLNYDPENVVYQSDVAITLNNLGTLLFNTENLEEAKEKYEKTLVVRQKLLTKDPENVLYQSDVGITLNNLGSLFWNLGSVEEAKKSYEKALEIYENLLTKDPENVVYQSNVGTTLNNLGALHINKGPIEEVKNSDSRKIIHMFLSYAYEDKEIAEKIISKAAEKGINTFYDSYELKAGDSLYNRLKEAISASDYLMVLLSPNSINSRWVQKELEVFLGYDLANRDITLLPVLISDCEIPKFLANFQYFDIRNNVNDDIEKLIEQIRKAPEINFSKLNPSSFENLVYDLMKELKFIDIEREPKCFGKRPDFKAKYKYFDPLEKEITETWIVEVKTYKNKRADVPTIYHFGDLLSKFDGKVKGLLITNSQLTSSAKKSVESLKANEIDVRIIDSTEIKLLLLKHNKLIEKYFSDSKVRK